MSLVLVWTNGYQAEIISDGLIISDTGRAVASNRKKFIVTPQGFVVAACGYLDLCERVFRQYENFSGSLSQLVSEIEQIVRNSVAVATRLGKPLGCVVAGKSKDGLLRFFNISVEETTASQPRFSSLAVLTPCDEAIEDVFRKRDTILSLPTAHAKDFLRELGRELELNFPDKLGGQFFTESFPKPFCSDESVALLSNQCGLTGSANASVSYTSTTSTITWSWSAFTLYFPDQNTVTISSGSKEFTGLASSTTYYFEFSVEKKTGTMQCVMSNNSTAPASLEYISQTVAPDGFAIQVLDLTAATTSSGSGGGSGGGGRSCFSGDTRIKTDNGFVRMDCLPSEFTVVNQTGKHRAQLIVHEHSESPMLIMPDGCLVTEEHLFQNDDRTWSPARELFKVKAFQTCRTVYNVHVITENPEDMHYILENGFVAHNKYIPN